MGRRPCCAKEGLNRGAWTAMEDKALTEYIKLYGEGGWRNLPKRAGLKRCGKSCRLRWLNYLRPDIKRGNISTDEEELIIRLHKLLGNRWSLIAGRLPGRTDNEIKNYWNTNLSKRVQDRQQRTSSNKKITKKLDIKRDGKPINNVNPRLQLIGPGSSRVIRTKAVKCSRVFINPPLAPPTEPPPPPLEDPTRIPIDTSKNNLGLVESGLEDFPTVDFSMMGELNISEFLDSQQLSDFCCEFSNETGNEGDQLSPSSPTLEEPIVFSEEMMEDWRRTAFVIDPSTVEYWLGE